MSGGKISMQMKVNGQIKRVECHPMARLLDVLREDIKLTGTKEGCGEGECGACSVIVDGAIVNSCLVPVAQMEGCEIRTIEGVGLADNQKGALAGDQLHDVQKAFLECGGAQCGICTPGMIIAAVHLLEKNPHPNQEEIKEGLAGNLCRCTGYMRIFNSVVEACAKTTQGARP